jgi:hypothetical protein
MSTLPLRLNSNASFKIGDDAMRGYKVTAPPNTKGLTIPESVILEAAESIFPTVKVIECYKFGTQTFTIICLPKSIKVTTQEKRQQFLEKLYPLLITLIGSK